MNQPRETDNNESVVAVITRLFASIEVIAEMQKIGDADQARQHELGKVLLGYIISLTESVNQSLIDSDNSAETREQFLADLCQIIVSQRDLLSAGSTSLYDRSVVMGLLDIFADRQATGIFIASNFFPYGGNHEPTVEEFLKATNLEVAKKVARKQKKPAEKNKIRDLVAALQEGLDD